MIAKWIVVLVMVGLALADYPNNDDAPVYRSSERYAQQYQSRERYASKYQSRERYVPEYQSLERYVIENQPRERYHPEEKRYKQEGMPYSFQYSVKDQNSGNDFGQTEQSRGDDVKGSYTVHLPDGRKQTVNYVVDDEIGYQAEVRYDGEAQYSQEYGPPVTFKPQSQVSYKPSYKPKTSYKPKPSFERSYQPSYKPSYQPQSSY